MHRGHDAWHHIALTRRELQCAFYTSCTAMRFPLYRTKAIAHASSYADASASAMGEGRRIAGGSRLGRLFGRLSSVSLPKCQPDDSWTRALWSIASKGDDGVLGIAEASSAEHSCRNPLRSKGSPVLRCSTGLLQSSAARERCGVVETRADLAFAPCAA